MTTGSELGPRGVNLLPCVEGGESLAWAASSGRLVLTGGLAANTTTLSLNDPVNGQPLTTQQVLVLPDRLYLVATTTVSPARLYVSTRDGATVSLLLPGAPADSYSSPVLRIRLGNSVLFTAQSSDSGAAGLWISDGTSSGTRALAQSVSAYVNFAVTGSRAFFKGRTIGSGSELWVTDGTPGGTRMVRDLLPGSDSGMAAGPAILGGQAYFMGGSAIDSPPQLWRSDGTDEGTQLVTSLAGSAIFEVFSGFPSAIATPNIAYFRAYLRSGQAPQFYATDGTAGGTVYLGSASYDFGAPMALAGDRFYTTNYGTVLRTARHTGAEQIRTVTNVDPGNGGRAAFAMSGQNAYCLGYVGFTRGLVRLDQAGTAAIARSGSAPSDPGSDFNPVVGTGDTVLFRADGFTSSLGRWASWRSNQAQTIDPLLIAVDTPRSSLISPLQRVGDEVAFTTNVSPNRLYFTDGSSSRTRRALPDSLSVFSNSTPADSMMEVGGRALLFCTTGSNVNLWSTSGDAASATSISGPFDIVVTTRKPYESGPETTRGRILGLSSLNFVTGGTAASTSYLSSLSFNPVASNEIDGHIYLFDIGGNLSELIGSPPVASPLTSFGAFGTVVPNNNTSIRDVFGSVDGGFIACRAGQGPEAGMDVYFINPVTQTANIIGSIPAGISNLYSRTGAMVNMGGAIVWQHGDSITPEIFAANRNGVWSYDTLVGLGNTTFWPLCAVPGRAVTLDRTATNTKLWSVDGTAAAPVLLLSSPNAGALTLLSRGTNLRALATRVVTNVGTEFYSSNGTAAGTFRAGVLPPDLAVDSSCVADVVGAKYIFTAIGPFGREPYAWIPCPADVASLGGDSVADGQLTPDDLIVYLDRFFAGSTGVADLTSVGGGGPPDGSLTPDDLIGFLQSFFAGCY